MEKWFWLAADEAQKALWNTAFVSSSVGPKMAETYHPGRTFISLIRKRVSVQAVIFVALNLSLSCLVSPAAAGRNSVTSVTFVGFLNDLQQVNHNGLSALLEVEGRFTASLTGGTAEVVATKSETGCKNVYGKASLLPPSPPSISAQRSATSDHRTPMPSSATASTSEGVATVQLSLPVHSSKTERTLYLCIGHHAKSANNARWHHLGSASKFMLPTVTTDEISSDSTVAEDIILQPFEVIPSGSHLKIL